MAKLTKSGNPAVTTSAEPTKPITAEIEQRLLPTIPISNMHKAEEDYFRAMIDGVLNNFNDEPGEESFTA